MKKIAIVMGSDSDLPVVSKGINVLKEMSVPFEVHVLSAHRTPEIVTEFAKNAKENEIAVIVAAAGKAAHLAGFIAANTVVPVIGLPIKSSTLDGLDSLLSTVQMPSGIPVATVAIDGAENACLLATQMLSISDEHLYEKLVLKREQMKQDVLAKDKSISTKYEI